MNKTIEVIKDIRTLCTHIFEGGHRCASPALQRGSQGFYVWVVQPDDTAEARLIDAMPVDDTVTVVTKGLSPGERVVVDGQSRLEAGVRVEPRSRQAEQTPG